MNRNAQENPSKSSPGDKVPILCKLRLHFWKLLESYPMADAVVVEERYCYGCHTWRRTIIWRDGRKEARDVRFRAWGVKLEGE